MRSGGVIEVKLSVVFTIHLGACLQNKMTYNILSFLKDGYKRRTIGMIKETIVKQMPNSFGKLYNQLNEQEQDIYLHLILYGADFDKVSKELKVDVKTIAELSDKIQKYLTKNLDTVKKDLGLGNEISDIVNAN